LKVQEKNKAGVLLFAADNITLPSLTRCWLAERLGIIYHKTYRVSPCPTLAKSKGVGLCLPQTYSNLMLCQKNYAAVQPCALPPDQKPYHLGNKKQRFRQNNSHQMFWHFAPYLPASFCAA
jgi:hypothetical protein